MMNIPKKVIDRFIRFVPKFQKVIQAAKDRDVNESDTVSVLNDILGEVFGYDKYLEVTSEFSIRGTYCDLALKVDDKIQFLIEVKAIGIELKDNHIKQAVDYGANHGVPWVVLTNGIEWRIYRIRFEQPINFDSVCIFNFLTIDPRDERDQDGLFLISKEGLSKNSREDFYEKAQNVNRYVIGNLILAEPVISVIRRELRKLADGMKIEAEEIEKIVMNEVLKREIVEGEQAKASQIRVNKFYRKASSPRRREKEDQISPVPSSSEEFASEPSISDAKVRDMDQQSLGT